MNAAKQADLVLSNGVEVNFKVSMDLQGNAVISSLHFDFPKGAKIPTGGIGASQVREVSINNLMALWFEESSRSYLDRKQRTSLIEFLLKEWPNGGRQGLPDGYYAGLSYLYVEFAEKSPRNPTAELAKFLRAPTKTVSTRLTQARKLGVLSPSQKNKSSGKASGSLTKYGKRLVKEILEGKNHVN